LREYIWKKWMRARSEQVTEVQYDHKIYDHDHNINIWNLNYLFRNWMLTFKSTRKAITIPVGLKCEKRQSCLYFKWENSLIYALICELLPTVSAYRWEYILVVVNRVLSRNSSQTYIDFLLARFKQANFVVIVELCKN
jgi:hypothetical protein